MRVETLAIGDELLTGTVADTHTAYVARDLFLRGLRLDQSCLVPDEIPAIQTALKDCIKRKADVVICFGGLGPTSDDKTAAAVAEYLGVPLVDHLPSVERLTDFLRQRGRQMTLPVRKQVQYPQGTTPMPNTVGLAPGFVAVLGQSRCFFLPGVPVEMKAMWTQSVLPDLESQLGRMGTSGFYWRTWKCLGIPESELQRRMDAVEARLPSGARLGYRTRFPENHLTLYWPKTGKSDHNAFEAQAREIHACLDDVCYTDEDQELEEIVLTMLRKQGICLAFAESCTGGLCSERLTRVPGSSESFWGGAVVYQVDAKRELLGVTLEDPQQAVSAECTLRLAQELKQRSGCAIAVAITGYMGPGGGTPENPVGTVYLAVFGAAGIEQQRLHLRGLDRAANRWAASVYALDGVRRYLLKVSK